MPDTTWQATIKNLSDQLEKLNKVADAPSPGQMPLTDEAFNVDLAFFEIAQRRASALLENVTAGKKRLKIQETGANTVELLQQSANEFRRGKMVDTLSNPDRDEVEALSKAVDGVGLRADVLSKQLSGS